MDTHIKDGLEKGIYTRLILDQKIIDEQNTIYNSIYDIYNVWINNIKEYNCNTIPKDLLKHKKTHDYKFYAACIYGTIKVHKADQTRSDRLLRILKIP